ncbi:MAG: carbamoyltransferase HypF [Gammaproteobacteria bacterium]|nr:carbamoyltransferase HypF [Gammaproteobacteria bacterium]
MPHTPAQPTDPAQPRAARRWTLTGQVQGVGFRPFVYRLAHAHALAGWVRNRLGEVEIHAEGNAAALDRFAAALIAEAPPLARPCIERTLDVEDCGLANFEIRDSASTETPRIHVPPDYFACAECLREVDDPRDRRFSYPFTNCTQCGPRYTLIERLPYDRANTSMAGFPLCPACQREYTDPLDRRFHAEPVACPACGPSLTFVSGDTRIEGNAGALEATLAALRAGRIVAIKGVGGYHLVCDARNAEAVAALRARKPRPAKPLAVMFPYLANAAHCVELREAERALLCSPMRPIVLARAKCDAVLAANIAPGLNEVGVLLPYAPLHHLLCRAFAAPLVMTSGNLSGEPVLTDNAEAQSRLTQIADAFLHHNRPIVRPADDPVFRMIAGTPRPLRLGRGCAPLELSLPLALPEPVLAVGGHLKLTVCLAWDARAVISPHIGDMGTPRSLAVFEQVVADLQRLYAVQATRLICDAHPGYTTTRWAQQQALPSSRVWHHHAHASALAGEYATDEDWLMFTWDGTGYGEDGTLWGGETLYGRPGQWQRVARLRPFRLPGGEQAGRAPWRSAAALCWETDTPFETEHADLTLLHQAWNRGLNAPQSSATGRVFDAAASLTGVLQVGSFEGQGPMYLEALAANADGVAIDLPLVRDSAGLWQTDWAPLLAALRDARQPAAQRAADLHTSLARAIRRQAEHLTQQHRFTRVGLTGGVFQNARLAELACAELAAAGFTVSLPERLPCNDAGIGFGQVVETLYQRRAH